MKCQVLSRRLVSIAAVSAATIAGLIFLSVDQPTASAVDIIWDGGDGDWNDELAFNGVPAKWNSGQTALDVFGRFDGWQFGSDEIGSDVFIPSGNVTYDTNLERDFRFIAGAPENGGTLNIGGGPGSPASLSMDISFDEGADQDGFWMQFNADTLNLNNGVLRRTHTLAAGDVDSSGGLMQFGGIRGFANADIKVNLTNGGGIENDGQLTFGWYLQEEDSVGRKITFTIDDGYLDLTGSNKWDHTGVGVGNADLNILYGWDPITNAPAGEEYVINFVGPGSITVDEGGILVGVQTGPGELDFDFGSLGTPRTYEHLWSVGILQANGLSGLDGEVFADYFTTENNIGDADYKLTRADTPPGLAGDFDDSGAVGNDDLTLLLDGWGSAPGAGWTNNPPATVGNDSLTLLLDDWGKPFSVVAGVGAVPEPSSLLLVTFAGLAVCGRRYRRS